MMTMTLDQAFDAGLLIDEAGRPIVSRKQLADAKWVTVHPNGAGSKGTPVQISENGTVLAGMGGKFNGKKLGELKGDNNSQSNIDLKQLRSEYGAKHIALTKKLQTMQKEQSKNISRYNLTEEQRVEQNKISTEHNAAVAEIKKEIAHTQVMMTLAEKSPDAASYMSNVKQYETNKEQVLKQMMRQ